MPSSKLDAYTSSHGPSARTALQPLAAIGPAHAYLCSGLCLRRRAPRLPSTCGVRSERGCAVQRGTQAGQIGGLVDVVEHRQEGDAALLELASPQRVHQRVLRAPAHAGEQVGHLRRGKSEQVVAAIAGRTEHDMRWRGAQGRKRLFEDRACNGRSDRPATPASRRDGTGPGTRRVRGRRATRPAASSPARERRRDRPAHPERRPA